MQKMIWIPKAEVEPIKKAAKEATKTGGIGAYLVLLHKEEKGRKDDGR